MPADPFGGDPLGDAGAAEAPPKKKPTGVNL
jgi:hypothetical protein